MSHMTARSLLSTGGRVAAGGSSLPWGSPSGARSTPSSPPLVARVAGGVQGSGNSFRSRRRATARRELGPVFSRWKQTSHPVPSFHSPPLAAGLHQPSDASRELLEYLTASGSAGDLCALAGSPPVRPQNAHTRDAAFAVTVQQLPGSPLHVAPARPGRAPGLASPPAAKTVQVGFACGGGQQGNA